MKRDRSWQFSKAIALWMLKGYKKKCDRQQADAIAKVAKGVNFY